MPGRPCELPVPVPERGGGLFTSLLALEGRQFRSTEEQQTPVSRRPTE